jgi:hypothetical protein
VCEDAVMRKACDVGGLQILISLDLVTVAALAALFLNNVEIRTDRFPCVRVYRWGEL